MTSGATVSEATLLLGVAAAAGIAGSLHCVAMCGGIASIGAASHRPAPRPLAAAALFHGARILSYATFGAVLAAAASRASAAVPEGAEAAGRWLVAGLMAALAVRVLSNRDVLGLERLGARLFRRAAPLWSVLVRVRGPWRHGALGVLWGLMPCGLLYSMLAVAAAPGRPLLGAAAMALFGLATAPALIGLTLGATRLVPALSPLRMRTLTGLLVLGCALWTALGGMAHGSHMHPGPNDAAVLRLPDSELPSRPATAPLAAARLSARPGTQRGGT